LQRWSKKFKEKNKMEIMKSIQESAAGWRMGFDYITGKTGRAINKTELGTAIIGPGFTTAQQRFAGVKAGSVSVQIPGTTAPVGVRYIRAPVGKHGRPSVEVADPDPGTPATVVETIQKSISESAAGWRMGFAHVGGKAKKAAESAQTGIEKSLTGWGMGISRAGSKVTSGFQSIKWQLLLPIIILIFIALMVAIGYSGLGGPAARVAEREYVKRR